MSTYKGERSVDGHNTYSLGSIGAPEWLVRAVERIAESRGVSRATAVRQMLHERLAAPEETEWEYRARNAIRIGGARTNADDARMALEEAMEDWHFVLAEEDAAVIVERRLDSPWLPVPGGEGENDE